MRFSRLAFGGLLLAAPFTGHAQEASAPRFSVGLGAYSSFYQPLGGRAYGTTGLGLPVQLTAGYQLRPRLAVQLGVAYSGSTAQYFNAGYYYSPTSPTGGTYFDYAGASTVRTASVSALARRVLTRNAAHRVQFDALGGLTLEHLTSFDRGTRADSLGGALTLSSYRYHRSQTTLLLTAGLGTRVRLAPRFDLTFDFTLNQALPAAGGAGGLTSSSALGLRYRLGSR